MTEANRPVAAECGPMEWSAPREITSSARRRITAQFPNLVAQDKLAFVVGTNIRLFDGSPVPESPLISVTLNGRDLRRPPGQFMFVMPTGFVDRQQRPHILWAEPRAGLTVVASDSWPPRQLSSVWHSSFDGNQWSSPDRVYEGADLLWRPGAIQDVVAVPTFTGAPSQPTILLRLRGNAWVSDSVPNRILGGPVETSWASRGNHEFLGLVGADSSQQRDVNSIFFQRSTDGGRSWSEERLIVRSGSSPAHQLRVIVTADSVVHLVWLERRGANSFLLKHAASRDDGLSWSVPDDDRVAVDRKNLRVVGDQCGGLHAVYEDWSQGPFHLRLMHSVWRTKWSAPTSLFDGWSAHSPSLVSDRSRMRLVFLARRFTGDTLSPYALAYSELRH